MKTILAFFTLLTLNYNVYAQQSEICNFLEIPDLGIVYGTDEPTIYTDENNINIRAHAAFRLSSQSKEKVLKTILTTKEYPGQLNNFEENGSGQINVHCLPCTTCVCFVTGTAIKRNIVIDYDKLIINSSDIAIVTPKDDVLCRIQLQGNIERIEPEVDKFVPLPGWGGEKTYYGAPRVQESGSQGHYIIDCFPQPSLCVKFVW
jgi:hypothetical protein